MSQANLTIIGTGLAITTIIVSTIAVVAGGLNDHLATITGQLDALNGRIEATNDRIDTTNNRIDTTNGRIDGLRNDLTTQIDGLRSDMREDHREFGTRLRNVEIEFGKVEQRLETFERAVLPQAPAVP